MLCFHCCFVVLYIRQTNKIKHLSDKEKKHYEELILWFDVVCFTVNICQKINNF